MGVAAAGVLLWAARIGAVSFSPYRARWRLAKTIGEKCQKSTPLRNYWLLARQAPAGRLKRDVAAPGVDIQPAAPRVAGVHAERLWPAETLNIVENPLYALLVELIVVAERDQIAQQRLAADGCAAVADHHGAPVGLMGYQAVGLQQMADQRLFDLARRIGGVFQQGGVEAVAVDADGLVVNALAGERGDRLAFDLRQA